MSDESIAGVIAAAFWPSEPTPQTAILLLLSFATATGLFVYGPLGLRLVRIGQLLRSVKACFDDQTQNAIQRQELADAFSNSPLASQWDEFVRRWRNAIAVDPAQNASLPELSRAPVRLTEVLAENPLLPAGARRSLVPALPALFLSAGLTGAFLGLVLALPGIGLSLDPPSFAAASRSHQIATLLDHLGMAFRIGLWGLLLSLAAAMTGRILEGRAEVLAETLDSWVQLAYAAISSGELATRTAHEQRAALARLKQDVEVLVRQAPGGSELKGSASVADSEAIARAITSLGDSLARRLNRLVGEQLGDLRDSMTAAIESLGQQSTEPDNLANAVAHLVKSSETQNVASRSLTQTTHTLSDAAEELRAGLDDFADVVTKMRETSAALALSSQRVDSTKAAGREQQERLDTDIREVRTAVQSLAETIHGRIGGGLQGERGPSDWSTELSMLRSTTDSVANAIAEIADAIGARGMSVDAPDQQHPQPRGDGHAPTRALHSQTGSQLPPEGPVQGVADAPPPSSRRPQPDSLPYVPNPEMMYSEGTRRAGDISAESSTTTRHEDDARGLAGLLRPTHHSGPSSDKPEPAAFDPKASLSLAPLGDRGAAAGSDVKTGAETDERSGDESADHENPAHPPPEK